ncbi:ATP-binding protein [Neobacillus sp. SM06]|uniref:ATP-binding protein n=1 Tax=Neobacillus sp. SM06 TaxID=3422492 RepID=UPI003D2743A3
MVGIEKLLLNILFFLVSILIYFVLEPSQKWKKTTIGLLSTLAIVLCMTFPFSIFPGYFYDLRIIPFILASLYGGYQVGLFATVILYIYRFYLGGDGFFTTVIAYTVLTAVTCYFVPKYRYYSRLRKMLLSMGLALFASLSVTIVSYYRMVGLDTGNSEKIFLFFVVYCILHIFSIWLSVFLIETFHEHMKLRNEIQQAEKMQVLGELAASIAHEVRNPLTVVRGFIQLLNTPQEDEKNRYFLKVAIDELDRAESIISEYLSYAKPQIDKTDRLDVGHLVNHVATVMSSYAAARHVEIVLQIKHPLFIKADWNKLSQACLNLAKNGIEAMTQGGTLSISAYKSQNKAVIEIRDTGFGMTREELSRLGQPFYSTKETGTGLGLMVSYRIIQAMHGRIEVQSEKGKGTAFKLIFFAERIEQEA